MHTFTRRFIVEPYSDGGEMQQQKQLADFRGKIKELERLLIF